MTLTLQYVLLPPPYTMPLHWFTDVTSWVDVVVLLTGPTLRGQEGNVTPAAAKHAVAVTVELVAPLELTVLTTVRMQVTWIGGPDGKFRRVALSHCRRSAVRRRSNRCRAETDGRQ